MMPPNTQKNHCNGSRLNSQRWESIRPTDIIIKEKEAYSYTYKEGTNVRTHYNKGIEWAQMYNERPSYTTIHKGTNMRLNTQKHSSVIIITSLLQSLSVANEQQTGTESPNTRHISY